MASGVYGSAIATVRSTRSSVHDRGISGGSAGGLPSGAPPSAQAPIVAIRSSVSHRAPTQVLHSPLSSRLKGGICRAAVTSAITSAHGRASS